MLTREPLAHFVGWPRLNLYLVERQAMANSTGVPYCGHLRVPHEALPASRPGSVACVDGAPIAFGLVGLLERLGFNPPRELVSLEHQRCPGLSHPLSTAIVRIGQSYRARALLPYLSTQMK